MSALEIQVYEIFEEKINQKKDIFLTKDDKVDLIKWMVSLIIGLFIALVASMATLLKLMIH